MELLVCTTNFKDIKNVGTEIYQHDLVILHRNQLESNAGHHIV